MDYYVPILLPLFFTNFVGMHLPNAKSPLKIQGYKSRTIMKGIFSLSFRDEIETFNSLYAALKMEWNFDFI
jgi:hypothetical protein